MQSQSNSLKEAIANALAGYVVYVIVLSVFLADSAFTQNLKIGIVLRLLSLIINYIVRRIFNHQENKNAS